MQKFFILGSVLIMGMGGLLTSAIETDASYTESERQHIKRFIGDDYAKLITGHYPVHSAEFHYRELDRTTFLLDKNPRDLAAHNDQAVANLHLGAFDKSEITLIGMLKDDDKRYATLANLGILYKTAGQVGKGADLTEEALKKRPRGHLGTGDYHQQAMRWRAKTKRDPGLATRTNFLGMPRDKKVQPGTDVETEQVVYLVLAEPEFADSYAMLGDILLAESNPAMAALAYIKADKLKPSAVYQNRLREVLPSVEAREVARRTFDAYENQATTFQKNFQETEFKLLQANPNKTVYVDEVLAAMRLAPAPAPSASNASSQQVLVIE